MLNFQHGCLLKTMLVLLLSGSGSIQLMSKSMYRQDPCWSLRLWDLADRQSFYVPRFLCFFHASLCSTNFQLWVWNQVGYIGWEHKQVSFLSKCLITAIHYDTIGLSERLRNRNDCFRVEFASSFVREFWEVTMDKVCQRQQLKIAVDWKNILKFA